MHLPPANTQRLRLLRALSRCVLLCIILGSCTQPTYIDDDPPERVIALTFDDAPRPDGPMFSGTERTDRLIEALEKVGVEGAMFFVTTKNISTVNGNNDARLRAYVDAGHHLANHSHAHGWLHKSEPDDYLKDIDQATSILAGFDGVQPFFRYPFLDEGRSEAKRDAVRNGLRERGLRNGYVTVDNYDWYMAALFAEALESGDFVDPEEWGRKYIEVLISAIEHYDELATKVLGRSPRHVLLLHENDLAALFIDDLVIALREQGWRIVPALYAYEDPIANQEPATLFLGQGRIGALARLAGWSGREIVHESEDESWLRQRFGP